MTFNKKNFKNNFKYMCILLVVVVLIVASSIFANSKSISEDVLDLQESGNYDIKKLVINEIANDNDGAFTDSDGASYDWVELYNGNSEDMILTGYTLSDDANNEKWAFKDITIKAHEYLVIYLSSNGGDKYHANFSLKKEGGEVLTLKNRHGKVVDIVETKKTGKNNSLARDLDGNWKIVNTVTPGYINTLEGYYEFIGSIEKIENDLLINEVLIRNGGQINDKKLGNSGYIELKNTTDHTINLGEYSLSNSYHEPFRWKLPEIKLAKGDIILIYTSGLDDKTSLHTNFKLNSKTGEVILSKHGVIVAKLEYENVANGYALSYTNGNYVKTGVLTGGYENTDDGVKKFADKYEKTPDGLIINEIMNNNSTLLAQNSHHFYDWIELKNNGREDINLKDYSLSTTLDDTLMYELPDVVLKPGEYYIVMASGDTNLSNKSYKHTNFKLSNVESLYLSYNGKVVDSMFISNITPGYSFGRGNDAGYIYMSNPTPGGKNNNGHYEISMAPELSYESGVYSDKIQIAMASADDIYYTLNGDEPTIRSLKYTNPITVDKTMTVKAKTIASNKYDSMITSASYIMNNHTLPVVSLSVDRTDFNRVLSHPSSNIEVGAHVSYFDGDKSFDTDCGIQLFGGSVRWLPKRSFALKFKKQYNNSSLNFPLYENRDNSVYETLVLRSGSQDYNVSMIRDPFLTSVMDDSNVLVQAMKPVILYINGEYNGIYYLNEKIDEDFIAARFNVDPDKTNIVRVDGNVSAGSGKDYEDLLKYMRTHDMTKDESFDYVNSKINIDSALEFWIAETYITNNDIINCRVYSNSDYNDGKWGFIFYDLDYAMYYPGVDYYKIMTNPEGMGSLKVRPDFTLYLFRNSKFKKLFVEKLSTMLKTKFSEENLLNRIDYYYNLLKPEIAADSKKWGYTMSSWETEVENLRNFVRRRKSYLLNQTRSFFNLSSEEMKVFYE